MENNEIGLKFTETENKIRKKWLFLSTILPAAVFGCFFLFLASMSLISSNFMLFLASVLALLIVEGGFYIYYHCAYKNPGTILLLLMMIWTTIGLLSNLLRAFFNPENLVFLIVMCVYGIIVLYYSYKLRKINKNMRDLKLTASPVYANALSVFSTATNIEELNEQFNRLSIKHVGSAVEALAKAYEQEKKRLTAESHPGEMAPIKN